jgi:hypothetical protein
LRRGFRELLLRHPEPYPKLNTILFITVVHGPARSFLAGYPSALRSQHSDLTVATPIQESLFANAPANHMEVRYTDTSPIASSREVVHTRVWAIPSGSSGSKVIAVFAQQPAPPDPECNADLESAIGAIQLD